VEQNRLDFSFRFRIDLKGRKTDRIGPQREPECSNQATPWSRAKKMIRKTPKPSRCATALGPIDANATAFAMKEIDSFLSRFASREMGAMLAAAQAVQNEKLDLYYLREHLILLGTLRFINTSAAEALTFEFVSAKNEQIRATLGLIACTRWPQRLLRTGEAAFTKDEYENLVAYASILHPDLLSSILGHISKSRLEERVARISQVGVVGTFGSPGIVVLD
jgi:hypothetical protein